MSPAARAPEAHVAEGEDSGAFVDGVRRHAERKRRERDDRLEGGAGRVGAAGGAVEERLRGVVAEGGVALLAEARHEVVGVEAGRARHREHVAAARVDHHAGAAAALEDALGGALDAHVESEREVRPRRRLHRRLLVDRVAERVDPDLHLAGHAAQEAVVVALHAGAADELGLEVVELLVAGHRVAAVAPDVADEVRGRPSLRIDALGRLAAGEARELARALEEAGERGVVHVAPADERARELRAQVAADALLGRARRRPDRLLDLGDRAHDLLHRPREAAAAEARDVADDVAGDAVAGEDDAAAVEDAPAKSVGLHPADRLPRLGVAVVGGGVDLQRLQAHGDEHEPEQDHRGDHRAGEVAHHRRALIPAHRHPPFRRPRRAARRRRQAPPRRPAARPACARRRRRRTPRSTPRARAGRAGTPRTAPARA